MADLDQWVDTLERAMPCPSCGEPFHEETTEYCWYVDLSTCAYFRRGLPGADPHGTCSFGCRDEPECQTCRPSEGWPREVLRAAVAALLAQPVTRCEECDGDGTVIHEGTPWPIAKALGMTEPDYDVKPCPSCEGSGYLDSPTVGDVLAQRWEQVGLFAPSNERLGESGYLGMVFEGQSDGPGPTSEGWVPVYVKVQPPEETNP